jgi:hypothetical protein
MAYPCPEAKYQNYHAPGFEMLFCYLVMYVPRIYPIAARKFSGNSK